MSLKYSMSFIEDLGLFFCRSPGPAILLREPKEQGRPAVEIALLGSLPASSRNQVGAFDEVFSNATNPVLLVPLKELSLAFGRGCSAFELIVGSAS